MHLTCTQNDLKHGLTVVSRAAASRNALPILANVLLTVDQAHNQVQLSATNLEVALTCTLPAQVGESFPGSLLVPAKIFSEFVQSLPPGPVTLRLAERETVLRVTGQRSQATIKGQETDPFPAIPTTADAGDPLLSFESNQFKEAVASVAFAAAEGEAQPLLTAVYMHQEREHLTFVAADGFSLAVRSYAVGETEQEMLTAGVLIPARMLADLARVLPDDVEVAMFVTSRREYVLFRAPTVELACRLIEGSYLNYQKAIPVGCGTRVILETRAFAEAVRSVALFAQNSSHILHLSAIPASGEEAEVGSGLLQLEASTEEIGDSASVLDAAIEGLEVRVALNVQYLAKIIAAVQAEKIAIELSSSSKPVVLKPVGSDEQCFVVMPMQIKKEG